MGFSNPLSIALPDGQIASEAWVNEQIAVVKEGPLNLRDSRVGCLLDGSDESAKVRNAFSLLPADGGEIYQPAGLLGLGSEVTMPPNTTWSGATWGGSIISNATGYTGRLVSSGVFAHMRNLKFAGGLTSGTMLTIRAPRSRFEALHFQLSGGDAIEFLGTGSATSAHANKLTDINIEDCVGRGIFIHSWAYDNEFLNTWIGECGVGLRIEDGACFFNNLHVWGCQGSGVEVRAGWTFMQNVYLETNGVSGAGHGVDIFNAPYTQIVGGRLWKNASNGALIGGTSKGARLSALDIHENSLYGVQGSSVDLCQVQGCHFYDLAPPVRQTRPINTTGTSDSWIITGNIMRAADHTVGGHALAGPGNVVSDNIV